MGGAGVHFARMVENCAVWRRARICDNGWVSMTTENLNILKDDMVAFIEGHGLKRLPGFVTEDLPAILWEDEEKADSWKDFVEMAQHCGARFITFSEIRLSDDEADHLIEEAAEMNFPDEESGEMAEAQWLQQYKGKLGYIQLGFVYQGAIILHETTTEWYERYIALLDELEGYNDYLLDTEDEYADGDEPDEEE